MDDLDRAQAIEEMQREQALQQVRRPAEEPETDASGNRVCLECGDIIPVLRFSLINAVRCVDCQSALEKHNKGYNSHVG
ncbi:hypothetical protein [Thiothrix nivea]|uniref:C4-type zinc finger DksA/TraR family protein n=1 Tax=Thiothrix nivea (strain ATCC 35100 / DSM 5205 / JP2) TaxID=870187 RepID=A0A656H975_THINJ|nr:hypothetical protein [Thiothrix nivea]EIJ33351.1 C4-type zinc finger DksA/TraR family protein [Thiothrix nivea DSM 5205]